MSPSSQGIIWAEETRRVQPQVVVQTGCDQEERSKDRRFPVMHCLNLEIDAKTTFAPQLISVGSEWLGDISK